MGSSERLYKPLRAGCATVQKCPAVNKKKEKHMNDDDDDDHKSEESEESNDGNNQSMWDQRNQDHSQNHSTYHVHISPGLVGWCVAMLGFIAGVLIGKLL